MLTDLKMSVALKEWHQTLRSFWGGDLWTLLPTHIVNFVHLALPCTISRNSFCMKFPAVEQKCRSTQFIISKSGFNCLSFVVLQKDPLWLQLFTDFRLTMIVWQYKASHLRKLVVQGVYCMNCLILCSFGYCFANPDGFCYICTFTIRDLPIYKFQVLLPWQGREHVCEENLVRAGISEEVCFKVRYR